ncbi:MAG TPA: hypothetical protein VIB79_15095 [Candidatus Binatia bacterium]
MAVVETVYRVTARFPQSEQFGAYRANAAGCCFCSVQYRRRLRTTSDR